MKETNYTQASGARDLKLYKTMCQILCVILWYDFSALPRSTEVL